MLVQKKVKKNKLILYIVISGLMLLGTAYFLYKNYTLAVSRANVNNIRVEEFNIGEADIGQDTSSSDVKNLLKPKDNNVTSENKELEILKSNKYKKLKENVVRSMDFKIGKKDPFEPY
ncbi:MAG: hypothetical protein ABIE43_02875 [Patescibacteria group bacterium]